MKPLLKTRPYSLLVAAALLPLAFSTACNQVSPTGLSQTTQSSPVARPTRTPHPDTAPTFIGQLDPTFGKGGKVATELGSTLDEAYDVAVQPDGKIVVLGETWPEEVSLPKFALVRYDQGGKFDRKFGNKGKVITNITGTSYDRSEPRALALQPDGKIIAVGSIFDSERYQEIFAVLRYNADGSLDEDFGDGGMALTPVNLEENSHSTDEARAVALAPDGKIVVAGITGRYPYSFATVRYNKDGSLDDSFGDGGRVVTAFPDDSTAHAVAVQPDGKVLVAGYGSSAMGIEHNDFALVRYNEDGSLDEDFGDAGIVMTDFDGDQDWAYEIALHPDGKITLAGPAEIAVRLCYGEVCSAYGYGFAQYNPDGSLDKNFGENGTVAYRLSETDSNFDLIRFSDGRLLTSGHISSADFGLTLLNPDGSQVENFGEDGRLVTSFGTHTERANAIALAPDGKVIAVGMAGVDAEDSLNGDIAIARYR